MKINRVLSAAGLQTSVVFNPTTWLESLLKATMVDGGSGHVDIVLDARCSRSRHILVEVRLLKRIRAY